MKSNALAQGQTFLMATVEKKQALPENLQKLIDELLADFLAQQELQDLSETLVSVAVAIACKNQQLKPDEVREKLKNQIKFVIQYWALEKHEGVVGQVTDRTLVDLVKKIVSGNVTLLGFDSKDIEEMFESGSKNGATLYREAAKADALVDQKNRQRKLAIAKLYRDEIIEALNELEDIGAAFDLGDKLIDMLAKLNDEELAEKQSVSNLIARAIAEFYRGELNGTILVQ